MTGPDEATPSAVGAEAPPLPEPTAADDPTAQVAPGPEEPVLVPPAGLVWVTLAVLALTAALAVLLAPAVRAVVQPTLQLGNWMGDLAVLEEMDARDDALLRVDAQRQSRRPPWEEGAFRRELAAWLRQEAELGSLGVQSSLPARMVLAGLQEKVRNLVLVEGPDALQALAVRYGRDVRRSAEAVLGTGARTQGEADVDELAPGMLKTLRGMGMARWMSAAKLQPAAARIVEALASQRVLELGVRLPDPPHLPSDVLNLLLRYRVEAHEGLSVQRRLSLLEQLAATDPSYPSVYVRGVLLARDGRCDLAIPVWKQAVQMRQRSAQARANLAWCRDSMAAGAP